MRNVSVILCAYNSEPFIQEAIDSVLGQTYQDFEFVIVDDGRKKGRQQASYLLSKLSEGEKIKVVTHSMGAAYGKGFIEGFIEYAQNIMEIANASNLFEFELDLAPFQPAQQNAVKDVKTYVVQHKYDLTAGTKDLPGAKRKEPEREDVIMHDKSFLYHLNSAAL